MGECYSGPGCYIIVVTVRNTGSTDVILASLRVAGRNGDDREMVAENVDKLELLIGVSKVGRVATAGHQGQGVASVFNEILATDADAYVTSVVSFLSNRSYKVTVVTDNGFTAEGTFSSPSVLPDQ